MGVTTRVISEERLVRSGPSWGAVLGGAALILSLIALGIVAFRTYQDRQPQQPAPPSEKLIEAPGPDNTIKTLPPQPDSPGPDNTIKSRPTQPAVPPAVPAEPKGVPEPSSSGAGS